MRVAVGETVPQSNQWGEGAATCGIDAAQLCRGSSGLAAWGREGTMCNRAPAGRGADGAERVPSAATTEAAMINLHFPSMPYPHFRARERRDRQHPAAGASAFGAEPVGAAGSKRDAY